MHPYNALPVATFTAASTMALTTSASSGVMTDPAIQKLIDWEEAQGAAPIETKGT